MKSFVGTVEVLASKGLVCLAVTSAPVSNLKGVCLPWSLICAIQAVLASLRDRLSRKAVSVLLRSVSNEWVALPLEKHIDTK